MSIQVSPSDMGQYGSIYKSPSWKLLVALKDELFDQWNKSAPSTFSEWHFLHDSLKRQGRIEGVMVLLKEIEDRAARE